jgi:uncharacterized protein (DUF2236 family)
MLKMTFGTKDEALGAAHGIDTIHGWVNGTLETTTGPHAHAGMYYSARDPELLKWVHSTFVDSMIKTYELYVRKLSVEEKDRYLKETSASGPMLGTLPDYFPTTLAELDQYIGEMLTNDRIVVSERARALADYVLEPLPVPVIGRLLSWYLTLPIVGLMPPNLRLAYGLRWRKLEAITLAASAWNYRVLLRHLLPRKLRRWPLALEAEKLAAS